MLYELVAGRLPFQGETKSHTVVSILETEPPSLMTLTHEASAELQRIVRKALTKDRDSRYQTARDLMIDLKSLRRDLDLRSELERSSAPSRQQNVSSNADVETQLHAASTHGETLNLFQTCNHFGCVHTRTRVVADRSLSLASRGDRRGLLVLGSSGRERSRDRPRIAVLPFVNQNNDPDSEYLSTV